MHTLSCVSLLATKKPAVQTGRFPSYPAIYAAARSAQPPDFTDILRTSYLAWRAILCIIAEYAFTGAPLSYNNTVVCVKGFYKKFFEFLSNIPGTFSTPKLLWSAPRPGTSGQRQSASRLFKTICHSEAVTDVTASGIRILRAGENGLSRQFANWLTMTQIRRNLIVKRKERILYAPSLIQPRSPEYTWAALTANSRAPASASVRVFPWPPTSTSRLPGRQSWLYFPFRSTAGRAKVT